jgi:hypothetical protein
MAPQMAPRQTLHPAPRNGQSVALQRAGPQTHCVHRLLAPGLIDYVCAHSGFVELQVRDAENPEMAATVLASWSLRELPRYAPAAFGMDDYFSNLPAGTSEVIIDAAGPRIWFDYKDALVDDPGLAETIVDGLATRLEEAGLSGAIVDWPRTSLPR